MFPKVTLYFIPFVYALSVIAIIYISLTTIRQIDLKKIIAYSSVAQPYDLQCSIAPSSFFTLLPINEFKHWFPNNLCIHYNNFISIPFLHFHLPCQIFENDRRNGCVLNIHESLLPHHSAMPTFNPIQLLAP
jgi:hypothetical protein